MKILVTGSTGQVGTELIKLGPSFKMEMIALGHATLDISNKNAVSQAMAEHQPDLVMNAAAYTAVDQAEEDADQAMAINSNGPANLAQGCHDLNIPLFHISSDYVFDGKQKTPYTEDDRPNPTGVYGKSKLAGDLEVATRLKQHLILRVAWVFGASGNNFVRTMLRLAKEHDELRVVADQFGGPTWVGDIATTLLSIAQRYHQGETIPWGTYNYTGVPAVNWHQFAETIFNKAVELEMLATSPKVIPISTSDYPTPAQRPQNSVLNCQKIKSELNISQPDWQIGLTSTLQTWKEQ